MNSSVTSKENKRIYKEFIQEIFNEGHFEKLDELVAPTYVLQDAPPGTPIGSESVKQAATMFRNAFPDLKIVIDELIAEGDIIAARSTLSGTHKGAIFGIPATGKTVCVTSLTMVRIKNGLLYESWVRNDSLGLLQQLGGAQK